MDPYLQLALAEGCHEGLVAALLDPAADPADLLASPPPLPPRALAALRDAQLPARAAELERHARRLGLTLLTPRHPDYPSRLRTAPLRPLVLFCRGDVTLLERQPAVAVVGSRTPTPYGQHAASMFASALAAAGVTLWSGLARGIDAQAHQACLQHGTATVAVLAGGLDRIYPPEHQTLAERIADAGCLLSEAPPGLRARRGHFPRRNRIVASATLATLVVEGSLASGALHTARFAAECGNGVFAVPGPWTSERSQGCHRLIAEGAAIAADPIELLRDLGLQPSTATATAVAMQASADEQAILQALKKGPRPSELVQRESGLDRATFLTALLALQSRGSVRSMPGDLLTSSR